MEETNTPTNPTETKKKKWLPPSLFQSVCITLIAILVAIFPIVYQGYSLYENAVATLPLDQAVEEIQSLETYVSLEEVPPEYVQALVHSEDRRFYIHPGIDPISITRAVFHDLLAGNLVEGGSTITQQLAKNIYFSFAKTFDRKVAEVFVAFDLESKYSKQQILEYYINTIYFGNGQYGLKAATQYYYGIDPKDMTIEQINAMVYTIKAPNAYNPEALGEPIAQP